MAKIDDRKAAVTQAYESRCCTNDLGPIVVRAPVRQSVSHPVYDTRSEGGIQRDDSDETTHKLLDPGRDLAVDGGALSAGSPLAVQVHERRIAPVGGGHPQLEGRLAHHGYAVAVWLP